MDDKIQNLVTQLVEAIRKEVTKADTGEINCTSATTAKGYNREHYRFGFSASNPRAEIEGETE